VNCKFAPSYDRDKLSCVRCRVRQTVAIDVVGKWSYTVVSRSNDHSLTTASWVGQCTRHCLVSFRGTRMGDKSVVVCLVDQYSLSLSRVVGPLVVVMIETLYMCTLLQSVIYFGRSVAFCPAMMNSC